MARYNRKIQAYWKGIAAEYLVAAYFFLRGYRVLQRRYRTPVGEVDLIVCKGRQLVMVEVKARRDLAQGLEAVTGRSRLRIERAAGHFLATQSRYAVYDVRFDVVAVVWPFGLRHLDNAWQVRS